MFGDGPCPWVFKHYGKVNENSSTFAHSGKNMFILISMQKTLRKWSIHEYYKLPTTWLALLERVSHNTVYCILDLFQYGLWTQVNCPLAMWSWRSISLHMYPLYSILVLCRVYYFYINTLQTVHRCNLYDKQTIKLEIFKLSDIFWECWPLRLVLYFGIFTTLTGSRIVAL